jgi:hypothetical protein
VSIKTKLKALLILLLTIPMASRAQSEDTPGKTLADYGYASNKKDLSRFFELLNPNEAEKNRISGWLKELGDPRFTVRDEAMAELMRLPILPPQLLKETEKFNDLEVDVRINRLRKIQQDRDLAGLIEAALKVIADAKIKGLTDQVLHIAPQLSGESGWEVAGQAATITSEPSDWEKFKLSLKNEIVGTRAVSLHVFVAAEKSPETLSLIKSLIDDPDFRILFIVANALAERLDRDCLKVYVKLLNAPTLRVRVAAINALRWATQQKFDYAPVAPDEQRQASIQQWKKWLEDNLENADVRLPIRGTGELVLYNGRDLTGWRMILGSQKLDEKQAQQYWKANGEVLSCVAKVQGYLRTSEDFKNYILTLDYRWPQGSRGGDGGIHLIQTGPDTGYPSCLEVQTHTGNAGDFYTIGGFRVEAGGVLNVGVRSRLADSSEKPIGQWNRIEATVRDGTVSVSVNGVLQNRATKCPQVHGKIALRIEGAPVDFRNIRLVPLGE